MKADKVNLLVQMVGMVAVVCSLVFVGLQLRQSQKIALAAQYQARMDAASSHYTSILQSPTALKVIGTDVQADMLAKDELSLEIKEWVQQQPVEELGFRTVGAIILLKNHDNVYMQYQSGFLSEEAWIPLRAQLKLALADERSWTLGLYLENKDIWRVSYRELIEELMKELAEVK